MRDHWVKFQSGASHKCDFLSIRVLTLFGQRRRCQCIFHPRLTHTKITCRLPPSPPTNIKIKPSHTSLPPTHSRRNQKLIRARRGGGEMSGVWVFDKKGVARLISNPTRESFEQKEPPGPGPGTATAPGARPRVLVYLPTNRVIRSFSELEQRLLELGWTRYHSSNNRSPHLVQFHRSHSSPHLISLPSNFHNIKLFHLYDIVVQNPCFFQVRDPPI